MGILIARKIAEIAPLRIHRPEPDREQNEERIRLLINGFPADLILYSPDRWRSMKDRPVDSILFPSGFRARLLVL